MSVEFAFLNVNSRYTSRQRNFNIFQTSVSLVENYNEYFWILIHIGIDVNHAQRVQFSISHSCIKIHSLSEIVHNEWPLVT